jgi:sec-independent protein translocase protein TatC
VSESFRGHLTELRRRLVFVTVLFFLSSVLSYPLAQPLLMKVKADLFGGMPLVILDPQEAVMAYVKVSMLLGFALTLPALAYHAWAFVAPGLLADEKRLIAYLLAPSAALFLLGAAFGYFIVLPVALGFLIESARPLATPMISLDAAMSFVVFILFALGVVFQIPLVTWALARLRVLSAAQLARYRRHAIVLIFLAAGIITPDPSPVTQTILAVPMVLLYEVGIFAAKAAGGGDARQ